VLSTSEELRLSLRWIAILNGRVGTSLAASTGVHTATDVLKVLLAGADVAMMTSALLRNGPEHVAVVERELRAVLAEHEHDSVSQLRGSMSRDAMPDPAGFERANHMRTLMSWSSWAKVSPGQATVDPRPEADMRVREVMASPVVAVGPDTSLKEVASLLVSRRINAVPVVDAGDRLIGIISEADLLSLETGPGQAPGGAAPHRAREVMRQSVYTLAEDTEATAAARMMLRHRLKSVPVVAGDPGGRHGHPARPAAPDRPERPGAADRRGGPGPAAGRHRGRGRRGDRRGPGRSLPSAGRGPGPHHPRRGRGPLPARQRGRPCRRASTDLVTRRRRVSSVLAPVTWRTCQDLLL